MLSTLPGTIGSMQSIPEILRGGSSRAGFIVCRAGSIIK